MDESPSSGGGGGGHPKDGNSPHTHSAKMETWGSIKKAPEEGGGGSLCGVVFEGGFGALVEEANLQTRRGVFRDEVQFRALLHSVGKVLCHCERMINFSCFDVRQARTWER